MSIGFLKFFIFYFGGPFWWVRSFFPWDVEGWVRAVFVKTGGSAGACPKVVGRAGHGALKAGTVWEPGAMVGGYLPCAGYGASKVRGYLSWAKERCFEGWCGLRDIWMSSGGRCFGGSGPPMRPEGGRWMTSGTGWGGAMYSGGTGRSAFLREMAGYEKARSQRPPSFHS